MLGVRPGRTEGFYRTMIAIGVTMFVITILAVGTAGIVYLGVAGRGHHRAPKLAEKMTLAARHLNGDGETPRTFTRLLG